MERCNAYKKLENLLDMDYNYELNWIAGRRGRDETDYFSTTYTQISPLDNIIFFINDSASMSEHFNKDGAYEKCLKTICKIVQNNSAIKNTKFYLFPYNIDTDNREFLYKMFYKNDGYQPKTFRDYNPTEFYERCLNIREYAKENSYGDTNDENIIEKYLKLLYYNKIIKLKYDLERTLIFILTDGNVLENKELKDKYFLKDFSSQIYYCIVGDTKNRISILDQSSYNLEKRCIYNIEQL